MPPTLANRTSKSNLLLKEPICNMQGSLENNSRSVYEIHKLCPAESFNYDRILGARNGFLIFRVRAPSFYHIDQTCKYIIILIVIYILEFNA